MLMKTPKQQSFRSLPNEDDERDDDAMGKEKHPKKSVDRPTLDIPFQIPIPIKALIRPPTPLP